MAKVLEQVRNNLVAIVSLFVALAALGYSTWRNERTEQNRNVREAGFALLMEIGSLQQLVFYAHFQPVDMRGDARALRDTWQADWAGLGEDQDAHRRIDKAIDTARRTTIERMRALR